MWSDGTVGHWMLRAEIPVCVEEGSVVYGGFLAALPQCSP